MEFATYQETMRTTHLAKSLLDWKGGPGLADGDAHPFCYILLKEESVYNSHDESQTGLTWVGQRFVHAPVNKTEFSFKKSIVPTDTMFYMGDNMCIYTFMFNM